MLNKACFAIAAAISVFTVLPVIAQPSDRESDNTYLKILNEYLDQENRIRWQLNDNQKVFDGKLICFAYQQGVDKREFMRDVVKNSRIYRDYSTEEANDYFATALVTAEEVYCPEFKDK
jgi:precorrin-2 methylase